MLSSRKKAHFQRDCVATELDLSLAIWRF